MNVTVCRLHSYVTVCDLATALYLFDICFPVLSFIQRLDFRLLSPQHRCHNGIGRPRVAEGGDVLQMWRLVASLLNKQSRTADNVWSSSSDVERGVTAPHRKAACGLLTFVNTVMNIQVH
jgi:hypothetical protein